MKVNEKKELLEKFVWWTYPEKRNCSHEEARQMMLDEVYQFLKEVEGWEG